MKTNKDDNKYMQEALKEAQIAYQKGEVPIGAILVSENKILSRGHNLREYKNDPSAHAEVIAIQQASQFLNSWRLNECELFVTVEPCMMCMGLILLARLKRLVYGCHEPKWGAIKSILQIDNYKDKYNHKIILESGVCESEASQLMEDFFKELRNGGKCARSSIG